MKKNSVMVKIRISLTMMKSMSICWLNFIKDPLGMSSTQLFMKGPDSNLWSTYSIDASLNSVKKSQQWMKNQSRIQTAYLLNHWIPRACSNTQMNIRQRDEGQNLMRHSDLKYAIWEMDVGHITSFLLLYKLANIAHQRLSSVQSMVHQLICGHWLA